MSISDRIVVMKDGVVQQIGKPQEVYDNPRNLFVAKFLGTPPINVFEGHVESGKLYIGSAAVLDVTAADGEVTVGIRPEGFVPDAEGTLECQLTAVEVMGRDITMVCQHEACQVPIRAIVDAEHSGAAARFSLKQNKVFLFDKESGKRL